MKYLILVAALIWSSSGFAAAPSYDAEATTFSYPFPVQSVEIKTQKQNLHMAYMDVAPEKTNGQVVVLFHGKNFGGYYWESTIKALIEKGFRVIVPDQIGFGKSSKPENYQFTFQGLGLNTHDLLDKLKIKKAVLVGHSLGGMLAVRFALMYPDLVSKLVLINPLGLEDYKLKIPYHSLDEVYAQELKVTPESIRDYQKRNYYGGKWTPENEALIQLQAGWTRHPDSRKIAWISALVSEMLYTQPVIYELPLLKVPTLLIIGQRDSTAPGKNWVSKEMAKTLGDYPKLGVEAARIIPQSKLVKIEGAGHLPQVEKFSVYKEALLGFLL